jgi:GAF domain-containing protein
MCADRSKVLWLMRPSHDGPLSSSPRPPVTPTRGVRVNVFPRFTTPRFRRRVERHRTDSADDRPTVARRTLDEAQETYALDLVDHYGITLFRLAWVISGDGTLATSAVVRVVVAAALDHARLEPSRSTLFELSRLTMWASLAPAAAVADSSSARPHDQVAGGDLGDVLRSIPPHERALVALTTLGGHTSREAAVVLGVDPEVAVDLLRSAVRAIGDEYGSGPGSSERPPWSTGEESRPLEPMPETREAMAEFMTRDGPEIDEVLAGLGGLARKLVPEVVGLSLGLVREGVTFTLIASNSGLGALDATQYLEGGPCVEVTERRRDVVQFDTDDPLDEGRWLLFAQTSAAVGVASSLSLPILRDGQVIGGINLYASTAKAFTGHHDELARALGASASDVVTNADLSFATRLSAGRAPRQLRDTQQIETATGLLAARSDHDIDRARARLRDAAARAGVDEALVAQVMILVHSS